MEAVIFYSLLHIIQEAVKHLLRFTVTEMTALELLQCLEAGDHSYS